MPDSPRHEFHVPGAYHFDNPPSFTTRALGADVFLPPVASSPADSTYLDLTRSAGSLFSDFSTTAGAAANGLAHDHGAKRKRAAQDSRESTPLAEWDANAVNNSTIFRDARQRLPHQAPNGIAYTLAGQIDIHGAPAQHDAMDESVYSDVEYRRALGPHEATTTTTTAVTDDAQTDAERWNVLHALGNVVGKVWEFCTTGGFRGFHAGGGAGYDWETGKPTGATEAPASADTPAGDADAQVEKNNYFSTEPRMPGPHPDSIDRETTPQRNGKRRQVSMTGDELGRNWVIVDPKQKHTQTQTPRRPTAQQKHPLRNGRASTSATPAAASTRTTRTPDRRATSYTRGSATTTTTTTVTPGTAASRRINTPISRIGGAAATTTTQHGGRRGGASAASAARLSHAGSPSLSSREPASFASPRSSTPVGGNATAASPRRPYAASSINGTYNSSTGGSRIPVSQSGGADASYNPFSRAAAASPRPGSRAGGRASSMALGATGSPAQNGHGHGHGHRRSYSGRVGMSPLPKQKSMGGGASSMDADGAPLGITESPRLNDEAKRLAAQNLAAEQASDAKMEAFNFRLQQMIRQGQEALGTTFEVDGDDDGGGGGPDDYWADD